MCAGMTKTYGYGLADTGIGACYECGFSNKRERDHFNASMATMSISAKLMLSPAITQQKV